MLKQLKAGAKLEDLAKKYSEDPGSAKQGGSLGWIGRGQTVPEFEKAAFSLPKGQISDLVKSSYGFHIIRVDDKQDAHVKTLDEVKAEIEPILKHQKAQQIAQKQADALLKQARNKGLDAAAATQGFQSSTRTSSAAKTCCRALGPQRSSWTRYSLQPRSPRQIWRQHPKEPLSINCWGSSPLATPTFEEIRSNVEDEFKNERSTALLTQKTQELSDRAKAEHDLKRAAKELGATIKTSDFVLPDGQVPDVGSMSGQAAVAFNMKPGEISGPISNGPTAVVLQCSRTSSLPTQISPRSVTRFAINCSW